MRVSDTILDFTLLFSPNCYTYVNQILIYLFRLADLLNTDEIGSLTDGFQIIDSARSNSPSLTEPAVLPQQLSKAPSKNAREIYSTVKDKISVPVKGNNKNIERNNKKKNAENASDHIDKCTQTKSVKTVELSPVDKILSSNDKNVNAKKVSIVPMKEKAVIKSTSDESINSEFRAFVKSSWKDKQLIGSFKKNQKFTKESSVLGENGNGEASNYDSNAINRSSANSAEDKLDSSNEIEYASDFEEIIVSDSG